MAALLGGAIALLAGTLAAAQSFDDGFARRLLAAHNAERARVGVGALNWSNRLAVEAQPWADELARRGALVHTTDAARGGAGENLWMSAPGWYGPEDMIGAFVNERQYFRPGRFPNVSTTGNWYVVGHYTQLIWRDTREVGCAIGRSRDHEVLVCRYWPSGNVEGVALP